MARQRRSGRGPDYQWFGWSGGGSVASDGSGTPISLGEAASAQTCVRVRGEIVASIDGLVDGDKVFLNAGIIVVSADAFARMLRGRGSG